MNILEFPVEIHEKILSYLDIYDLVSAAKSCNAWRCIGNTRFFKPWCLKNISPDVLNEITENQFPGMSESSIRTCVSDGLDWQSLCAKWARTAYVSTESRLRLTPEMLEEITAKNPSTITNYCVCMAISGDLIVVGDKFNDIVWYDCNGEKIAKRGNFGEPALYIGLLNLCRKEPYEMPRGTCSTQHDSVIIVSHEFIAIYSMPMWNCQKLYYLNVRHGTTSISVQGNQFAYYNCDQHLMTVCVVRRRPNSQCDSPENLPVYPWVIQVKTRCTFSTKYNVHNWKLWKNSLVCLVGNGTIMTWNLDDETTSQSILISDFLYPYQSFMFRGMVFCNVSTARTLLRYWHVNMGEPHWIVSTDGLTFKRMSISINDTDQISTISIKRTVIVAGTDHGNICIYRHTGSDHDIPDVMMHGPSLTYKMADTGIFQCDFSLDSEHMVILARTERNTLQLLKLPVMEKYS